VKKYLTIFCLLNFLIGTAHANSWQAKLAELKELAGQIAHLKLQLKSAHRQKALLIDQVKNTDSAVASLTKNIDKIKRDLAKQQTILTQLQTSLAKEQSSLYQQQQQLKQQLSSAYMFGNTDYLKLLLNQQDPNGLSQTMTYYRYLMAKQISAIDQIRQTITRIEQQQQAINAQTLELHNLQNQSQIEQQGLLQQKTNRQRLLAKISSQIEDKSEELQELNEDQHNLEGIITKLKMAEAMAKIVHFPTLHGNLPWPLHGRLLARFGSSIENSELTWKGIIIAASEGDSVQAVAPGKVIFANWLKGFGFLIILDHSNGYMTLYGRNESLYKKVGDVVQTGELIARAGQSGGFANSGLYFEIRRNGVALNPLAWLS
jgi:septal ring factor EnvC (AmiA/AmiB activator)